MARRRKNPGRRNYKFPMSIVIPLIAGPFLPAGPKGWASPYEGVQHKDWGEAARTACVSYTFYDPGKKGVKSEGFKWDGGNALKSLIAGALVHKFIGSWPLNLNKQAIFRKLPVNI